MQMHENVLKLHKGQCDGKYLDIDEHKYQMLYIMNTKKQFDLSTSRQRCSSANEREKHNNILNA